MFHACRPSKLSYNETGFPQPHTVQELLGHCNVRTTMIYTRVLNRGGRGVQSPADRLLSGVGDSR